MAGKKKKSLANKLAKMSDEERARYLQHRAEVEEEARRRREQLIATFMKKKIKKEDAFSRLNLAKINQKWHQIMRKMKVKEMKNDVEYLKKWIERVLENKNRIIEKLLCELEEAEEQYLNNFNSHSTHLNSNTEDQNKYIDKMQLDYEEELQALFKEAVKERNAIIEHANAESTYLKTVIYGQNVEAEECLKENWESYSKKLYEVEYNNRIVLKRLQKTSFQVQTALWHQIHDMVQMYVRKTDTSRSHLRELYRIDEENAKEIRENDENVKKKEETYNLLKQTWTEIQQHKTDQINALEAEQIKLKKTFIRKGKILKIQSETDESQLRILAAASNESINYLTEIQEKGTRLLNLYETCGRYETEKETTSKWFSWYVADALTDDEKLVQQNLETDLNAELTMKKDQEATCLDDCYSGLEKLENFWTTYNKTEVDIMELEQEKTKLEKDNKQLKGLIRAVLEAVALSKSAPNSRGSRSRCQSRSRGSYSAPSCSVQNIEF